MSKEVKVTFPYGNAICYSGFREGQRPGGLIPNEGQILQDLKIIQKNWQYIRLYDCDPHAERVLKLIDLHSLDLQVMLGAYVVAEENNPNCPWGGGMYPENELKENRKKNDQLIRKLIRLAESYKKIVFSVSVGNECTVEWNDHMVSVERLIEFTKRIKSYIDTPVTFCENYVPWTNKLRPLVEVLDFISIHTYPVWEYRGIEEALSYTKENYYQVARSFPNKPVIISEAGWSTKSNGRGIPPENVNEELQRIYYNQLMEWVREEEILCFVFEAFDEPWKGSPDPLEPEKHWGLFKLDRTPKLVMSDLYD